MSNAYSMSVKFVELSINVWQVAVTFNLLTLVFVSGQIVTVGNGIAEIGVSFSVKLIVTGLSHHFIQILWMDDPHNQTDRPKAKIHQNLIVCVCVENWKVWIFFECLNIKKE